MKLWNWFKRMWWLLRTYRCSKCEQRFHEVFADPYDIFGANKVCAPCWLVRQRSIVETEEKIKMEREVQNQRRILLAKEEAVRQLEAEKQPYRDRA